MYFGWFILIWISKLDILYVWDKYYTEFILDIFYNVIQRHLELRWPAATAGDNRHTAWFKHRHGFATYDMLHIIGKRKWFIIIISSFMFFLVVLIWVDLSMKFYQRLPMIIHPSTSKFISNFVKMTIFTPKWPQENVTWKRLNT